MIRIKRVFEAAAPEDGRRFLVDRLWPRGMSKAALKADNWHHEVAPSDGLRRWFNHSPEKWPEFRKRYSAELNANPEAWAPLLEAARQGYVTLVYAASDLDHNNAIVLRDYLMARLRRIEQPKEGRPDAANK